jgi:hypothetical protein
MTQATKHTKDLEMVTITVKTFDRLIAENKALVAALLAAKGFIEAHDETHKDGATLAETYNKVCAALAKFS